MLRASEHLIFASLASAQGQKAVSERLERAIHEEYEHLSRKAEEHRAASESGNAGVASIMKKSARSAAEALKRQAYRQALELIRASEALAHVDGDGVAKLGAGRAQDALARAS